MKDFGMRYYLELTDYAGRVLCNWSQPFEAYRVRDLHAQARAFLDVGKFRLVALHANSCWSEALGSAVYKNYSFYVDGQRYFLRLYRGPNADFAATYAFGQQAPDTSDDESEGYSERLAELAPWKFDDESEVV